MNSIITDYENISVISGRPAECKHHLLSGTSMRRLADEDGLFIPLTNDEHNLSSKGTINQIHGNPIAESLCKMLGQMAWERMELLKMLSEIDGQDKEQISTDIRKKFMKRFGKSFL